MQSVANIIELLIVHKGNIHAQEDAPLRWAAEAGHLDFVKYLVEEGANIHAAADEPLFLAAKEGHLDVVKFLVEKGANIHTLDYIPLRWAAARGHLEVAAFLRAQKEVKEFSQGQVYKDVSGTYYLTVVGGYDRRGTILQLISLPLCVPSFHVSSDSDHEYVMHEKWHLEYVGMFEDVFKLCP